jgi:hypothetical protein
LCLSNVASAYTTAKYNSTQGRIRETLLHSLADRRAAEQPQATAGSSTGAPCGRAGNSHLS